MSHVNLVVWLSGKNSLIARNGLMTLRYYETFIALARKGTPYDWAQLKRLEEQWQREVDRPPPSVSIGDVELTWDDKAVARWVTPVWMNIFHRAATYHALQRLGQVVAALRLYRSQHGRYPDTLQELAPKYLPSVLVDPFDGKPLRYRRLPQGFKVWSIS